MFSPPKSDAKFAPSTVPSGFSGPMPSAAQTVIARGVRVEGDFRSQGNVTIEGELVGSLTCGGHLTVGSEANIQAAVTAEDATISGAVQGDLHVAKKVELQATARIKGDVTAGTVAIEPGAVVEGMFRIGAGGKADKRPEPAAMKPKIEPAINTPAEAKAEAAA